MKVEQMRMSSDLSQNPFYLILRGNIVDLNFSEPIPFRDGVDPIEGCELIQEEYSKWWFCLVVGIVRIASIEPNSFAVEQVVGRRRFRFAFLRSVLLVPCLM